jgi:hypothetical protein
MAIVRIKDRIPSPQSKLRKCSINLDRLATWLVAPKTKNKSDSDLKEVVGARVTIFFLVQNTKTGKIPNNHKI